jgi:hypothetical protein
MERVMMKTTANQYPAQRRDHSMGQLPGRAPWPSTALAVLFLAVSILLATAALLGAGVLALRWTDAHLPHVALSGRETHTVNRTELVRQIRAFQLITAKQTYATHTEQTVSQTFSVGTSRVALPGWLASEQMRVEGQAQVLAGVDLSQVKPEDITVTGSGKNRSVQVAIPQAQVLSTELVPNTLHISTMAGVLPQLEWALGISDDQLRNRSADSLLQAGRQAAEQQGIETSAAAEAQQRLTSFLQALPADGGHISYTVVIKPSSSVRASS